MTGLRKADQRHGPVLGVEEDGYVAGTGCPDCDGTGVNTSDGGHLPCRSCDGSGEPSRYELLYDDPQFGLSKGDVLICAPMHWAWAHEKVAVVRRERDGYEPGCSQYRDCVRHLSGPRS